MVELDSITNDDFKKRPISLINLYIWPDECSKCGHPKVLHKELHKTAACTQDQEVPNILSKNWTEYRKMVKLILKDLKETYGKEAE